MDNPRYPVKTNQKRETLERENNNVLDSQYRNGHYKIMPEQVGVRKVKAKRPLERRKKFDVRRYTGKESGDS